jgi:hypothetical protein
MQTNRPKYVKSKVRECKLTSSVNWQGTLKQKGIKRMGIQQGLHVFVIQMF